MLEFSTSELSVSMLQAPPIDYEKTAGPVSSVFVKLPQALAAYTERRCQKLEFRTELLQSKFGYKNYTLNCHKFE